MDTEVTPITPLPRDLRRASSSLGIDEVRYLVDTYYQMQEFRKAMSNQSRSLTESGEPHETLLWFGTQFGTLEKQITAALDNFSKSDPLASWARDNHGIGPVIASGLRAHIDISKVRSAGQVWAFAGLSPEQKWEKGKRRPWNARLKVLCWKIGDSFVKNSGNEKSFYGHIYRERKDYEIARDLKVQLWDTRVHGMMPESNGGTLINGNWYIGGNCVTAARTLTGKNIKEPKTLAKYQSGHLPDGQLDMRARRYAVKLFLAHYFEAGWRQLHGTEPPLPYPIAHMGHTHIIEAPVPTNGSE